jgi:hypothetical protein
MPTIVEVKVYKFEELNDKAKEVAREWMRDADAQDSFQSEAITDSFTYWLDEEKLPSDDIRWSLSCCQGDGVAFYGTVDLEEYLTKNKLRTKYRSLIKYNKDYGIKVEIEKSQSFHRYDHWNTMRIEVNQEDFNHDPTPQMYSLMGDLEKHLRDKCIAMSSHLETKGYEQLDYNRSDEVVDESINANEYDFEECGRRTTIAE